MDYEEQIRMIDEQLEEYREQLAHLEGAVSTISSIIIAFEKLRAFSVQEKERNDENA